MGCLRDAAGRISELYNSVPVCGLMDYRMGFLGLTWKRVSQFFSWEI